MNWQELKEFCNKLKPEHLENKVVLWRESEAIGNLLPEILEDDYYFDRENPDAGCFTLADAEMNQEKESLEKVYEKGEPILWEDFNATLQAKKNMIFEAWAYCDENDKSTEFMFNYIASAANMSYDAVVEFISDPATSEERKQWYENRK